MLVLSGSTSNGLKTQTETLALSWVSSLLNHCAEAGLASLHIHISQFLAIHLLFYMHTYSIGSLPLDNPSTHVCVSNTGLPSLRMRLCPDKTITI